MFDRNGNPTDDADLMVGGCDTFDSDPAPDFDGMEYDDYRGGPKCGGCGTDDNGRWIGPGCRHCFPPDHECKPYGFGIERWDFEPRMRLVRELSATAWFTGLTWDQCRECATKWSGFSNRRLRHSNKVWDRLCDECETHTEAVEKYEQWAKRAVTVKYRDEK
jgi:hypothetical protein